MRSTKPNKISKKKYNKSNKKKYNKTKKKVNIKKGKVGGMCCYTKKDHEEPDSITKDKPKTPNTYIQRMFQGRGNQPTGEFDPEDPRACGVDPTTYSHKFLSPVNNALFRIYWNDLTKFLHKV